MRDEYINGERNGVGKEFDEKERLIFEGEYLNGKRWNGKIKHYGRNNKLEFEGDLINGERNGKGKEYDFGRIIYEGEYLNGKKHGKGKEYFDVGEIYSLLIKSDQMDK